MSSRERGCRKKTCWVRTAFGTPKNFLLTLQGLYLQKAFSGHPKLLAFITHAGANSVMEAALAGVPMICIPMFGDGMRNAKMAEYRGIARIVKKKELSAETLTDAIKSVILDKR